MTRKQRKPPYLAARLFDWYCSDASVDDLRGDLDELFYRDMARMSVTRARFRYWKHTLQLIISYGVNRRKKMAATSPFSSNPLTIAMLKNYFLIATRSLARHKFFTLINVLGLAIGMSISLLFIAMLSSLWRYDTFHTRSENIYRIVSKTKTAVDVETFASTPAALADELKYQSAGIEEIVRINKTLQGTVSYETREIPLEGYFVDPGFLKVFTFPLLKGNAATALEKPNSVLITKKAAGKLFGNEDAFGKIISIGNYGEFEITGIMMDINKESHMQFEILGSYATLSSEHRNTSKNDWLEFRDTYIYVLLANTTSADNIERYLQRISDEFYSTESDLKASFSLQALNAIVPGPDLANSLGPSWDYPSLSIFLFLTLLILVPACFNYANIAISRALKRMKEIGIRKVMGGQKGQIFLQFILETVIIAFVALGISAFIFSTIKQEFVSLLVGGAEGLDLTPDIQTIFYFIAFTLFVGLVAGVVPALYFSKLTPIQALKSKTSGNPARKFSFRKGLTVFQFALSLGFIMSVVIVFNQYRSTINYDFGFDQANILDVELQDANPEIFHNELSKLSSVQSVSMSSHVMGTSTSTSTWVLQKELADSLEVFQMFINEHYLTNLDLKLLAGKNFSSDPAANKNGAIINEEFLKQFHINNAGDAIGQSFTLTDKQEVVVIGVVKNFHYLHLREPIRSFFFRYDPTQFKVANIKILSTDIFSTVSEMEAVWKNFGGEQKFEAAFFDDEIEEAYSFYFAMIKICGFLGLLAISISCLGLLGMVVFTVENRLKEVGIRKVMGASTATITILLSKNFAMLMVIAAMFATPITCLFFNKVYLSTQYYKIAVSLTDILISLIIMLALGLTTILSQTLKAAKTNPVDTLRNE